MDSRQPVLSARLGAGNGEQGTAGMRIIAFALLLGVAATAPAQMLRLPPVAPRPSPPDPGTGTAAATDISRKMQVLEVAGLTIPTTGIQTPVVLSAKRPWLDSRTHLDPVGPVQFWVDADTILFRHDGDEGSFLNLWWAADPSKRHIVDCAVTATASQMRYSWQNSGRSLSAEVTVDKGRAAVVLPPGTEGKITVQSNRDWRFHGCEITPVDG